MRPILFFASLSLTLSLSSQDTLKIDFIESKTISGDFYNERWEDDTTKTYFNDLDEITNQSYAEYYQLTWKNDTLWQLSEHDMNGQLLMRGAFSDKNLGVKQGEFELFYSNGSPSQRCSYRDGYIVGEYSDWYENGELDMKGRFADNLSRQQRIRIHESNKSGVFPSQKDSLSVRDGIWKFYHSNGLLSAKKEYDKGKLIAAEYFNEDGQLASKDVVVDVMPAFPGGIEGLMKYLQKNIKYPKEDRRKRREGLTMVKFVVNRDGIVEDAKVIKSVTPLMDQESLRVVNSMPKWTPGKKENRRIKLEFNLPIQFQYR